MPRTRATSATTPVQEVFIPPLKNAGDAQHADLHKAALEWSILAPIIIRSIEDVKSRPRWAADLTPFIHQYENLFTFCRRLPVSLIADDVGLGKTISAGLVLSELMVRQRVSRTLVLCPKILCEQWQAELTDKFGIPAFAASGIASLENAVSDGHPVVISTYHSALRVLPSLDASHFEMLILDEAHKLRNLYGTAGPPRIAMRVREALQKRIFSFVLMLTATPLHNRLWDIYSLIDLLSLGRGHANPFGEEGVFRAAYINTSIPGDRVLRPEKKDDFRAIVRDYMVRTRRLDAALPFPERTVRNVVLPLSPEESQLFESVGAIISHLSGLEQASLAKALLGSPQALAAQLSNMVSRLPFLADACRKIGRYAYSQPMTAKLTYLAQLVETLRSQAPDTWRLLIFTERRETQEAIKTWCESVGVSFGLIRGGDPRGNQNSISQFKLDPPGVHVLISTDSGAEGVNLQVCNYVVNFDLPWNPMLVEQRIGRVQRLASPFQEVIVCNLVLDHPADAHVVGLLMAKLAAIGSAVDDIESVLEDVPGNSDGDDAGESFAATIQDLVVRALQKRDVTRDREVIERNIEIAQQKKREHEQELEQIFGTLADEPPTDIRPPDLAYPEPSLAVQDFVLQAKALEGVVEPLPDGVFLHTPEDGPQEHFTFDKDVAQASQGTFGQRVTHYDAGTPAFQRLVGRWAEHHHLVTDLTCSHPDKLHELVTRLLSTRPRIAVTRVQRVLLESRFAGHLIVRAQGANGVDRYEKLIPLGNPEELQGQPLPRNLRPEELPDDAREAIVRAVEGDPDITAFVDYYADRLRTEAARAKDDVTRLAKVSANFQTRVSARVVVAKGALVANVDCDVHYTINGQGDYVSRFTVDTQTSRFIREPECSQCRKLEIDVPVDALAECAVTGITACRHLMAQSSISCRWMLQELAITCGHTQGILLPEESGTSDASGMCVDKRLLVASELSGRLGLEHETAQCAFTGLRVLRDEAVQSAVSGQVLRKDIAVLLSDGRHAHDSELTGCPVTGALLPEWELAASDYSGIKAAKDALVASDLPPHRRGLPTELVRCVTTGKQLLLDEARQTDTGDWADANLFTVSELSGQHALRDALIPCDMTGKLGLPSELGTSSVSNKRVDQRLLASSVVSGERALPEEMATCEISGSQTLPAELVTSDISGKQFRRDQAASLKDGRTCHTSECRPSDATGELLTPEQGDYCQASGKWVEHELLMPSAKSGRKALGSELRTCQITNRLLCPDEVAVSASGVVGDRELLSASDISGEAAFTTELVACEETGRRGFAHEMGTSDVSGKRVDKSALRESPVDGRYGTESEFQRCTITNTDVLRDELVASEVSGRKFRKDQITTGDDGSVGHTSEFVRCSLTRRLLPTTQTRASDVSGVVASADLLVTSDKNPTRWGLSQETVTCAITGKRLLTDEVAKSEVSGRPGDASLLVRSARSGRQAFPDEFVACPETHIRLLPEEMESSSVSGARVAPEALQKSSISDRKGLASECERCEVTNTRVLRDEITTSDISGRRFRADEQVIGADGRRGHRSEFRTCDHSGQLLAADQGDVSSVSGKWVGKQFLVASEKQPHRKALPSETARCEVTGKTLLQDEVTTSPSTGRVGDKTHLAQSAASKTWAFTDELVQCSETKHWLLPSETVRCEATGLVVDARLAGASQESQRPALKRLLVHCAVTGKLLLPDEVAKCEYTGKVIASSLLGTCNATKKRVLKAKLVQCDIPRGIVLDDDRVRVRSAKTKRVCARSLAKRCQWTGAAVLPDEVAPCSLSGLLFDRDLVRNQEFALLRDLLNQGDEHPDCVDQASLVPWLNAFLAAQGISVVAAAGVLSPDGTRAVVIADAKKRLWNKLRRAGLIATVNDSPAALSPVLFGTVGPDGWEQAS
jgi:superfamily II DNA or RNA helicase